MTRWNRRLLFGAIALLLPALAGCEAGFNAPTLQYHPANFAANTVKNGISFSNLFVLDTANNGEGVAGGRAGVFLSLYAQNGDRLTKVSAPDTASSVKIAGGSVDLPADAAVNLGGPVPKVVLTGLTNPLQGGQTVTAQLHVRQGRNDHHLRAGRAEVLRVRRPSRRRPSRTRRRRPGPSPPRRPRCPARPAPPPTASGGATGSATATASASNSGQ